MTISKWMTAGNGSENDGHAVPGQTGGGRQVRKLTFQGME